MTDQSFSFGAENDTKLRKISEDWVNGRYYESLIQACGLLLEFKDDRESQLNRVAVEFIHQNSSSLTNREGGPETGKQDPACSFCGMSPPDVKLGAGPSVFICDKCVDVFHKAL